jgi:hypothetical protein
MKKPLVLLFATLALATAGARAEEPAAQELSSVPEPVVTREADRALAAMGKLLQSAKSLSFTADVTYDVLLNDGQLIQYGSRVNAAWKPGKSLHVKVDGDDVKTRIYVDKGEITWVDDEQGIYATDKVPGDLDTALEDILSRLELEIPLTEIFYSDPYKLFRDSAYQGRQVGIHEVAGVKCRHLAFIARGLDWQVWIEDGDEPLLRKLVIDYRNRPGSPKYSATITSWQVNPKLSKDFAKFSPTDSETKVEFLIDTQNLAGGN